MKKTLFEFSTKTDSHTFLVSADKIEDFQSAMLAIERYWKFVDKIFPRYQIIERPVCGSDEIIKVLKKSS